MTVTDWDAVAGAEPSRNGTRRIVSADEGCTPYSGDRNWWRESFVGVEMEIGTSGLDSETTSYVNLQPHDPTRPRQATEDWMIRHALNEADAWDDLYTDGDTDDPLPGYQPETTGDYREADPEDPRGDGVYRRDDADSPLTAQIADVVTRNGGRIPVDFSAAVQNEGYARSRDWTVYAPQSNPYHVAAQVTDLLQNADGVSEVNVWVDTESGADHEAELRRSGFGYAFDVVDDSDSEQVERLIREVRWQSGLSYGRRQALDTVPTDAREQAIHSNDGGDGILGDSYETALDSAIRHPGDAWEHCRIDITIHEEATEAYYG